jgi:hypothetical protein
MGDIEMLSPIFDDEARDKGFEFSSMYNIMPIKTEFTNK